MPCAQCPSPSFRKRQSNVFSQQALLLQAQQPSLSPGVNRRHDFRGSGAGRTTYRPKNRTKTKGEWTGTGYLNILLSSPASYTSVISMILLSSLRSNNIRDLLELNPVIAIIQHNQQRLTALINRTPSHHGSLLVTCYAQATHRPIYSYFPAFRAPSFLTIIPIYTHIIRTSLFRP
jgi:hypothetical protein